MRHPLHGQGDQRDHVPRHNHGRLGVGFRVQGVGFRVQGSGFRVQGSGFRVQGSRFRVQGWDSTNRYRASALTFQGVVFRV